MIAVAALMAMSVPAQADGLSGWGEAYIGTIFGIDVTRGWRAHGDEPKARGGGGFAVNLPVGGGWNLQAEGFASGSEDDNGFDFFTVWGGGGFHGYYRDADHAYGIFGGAAALQGNEDSLTGVVAGAEAAWFCATCTWIVQAGYISRINSPPIESDDDFISDGGFIRVLWRKFFDDNMMLQLGVTGAVGQEDGDQDEVTVGVLRAGFEHIPDGWPVAYFARLVSTAGNSWQDGEVAWNNELMLGLRLYFGHETLKSNDRGGTTFDLPPLRAIQEINLNHD